ncbi:MAG: TetR/AcrR family transcriptional regulator [Anaerolineales bacterium]|nr:TetR/AcrR family transcriptional regulator [Anaerolineales bacterium]MBP6210153.1 TetR/AcrR family transcriptional regulator [Anaerolineales bacterium]
MVRPSKKTQIPNLQEAIKETAWKQIAETGAAALSLRAIARELNITAPAIYNYFPDRDALVTALIIDAYTSFGDSQLAARDALPEHQHLERLKAIGMSYRQWAITHPQRYQLIFGTPIPGYQAPLMEVLPSAARSLGALVSVIEQLRVANKLQSAGYPAVQPEYEKMFEVWTSFAGNYDILSLAMSMLIWSRVHGLVSLEISNNMPPFGVDGDSLYKYELDSIAKQFIKA